MKRMIVGLLLVAGAVQAEGLSLQYNARVGVERAVNGDYYLATRAFEAAARESREKFAAQLDAILPVPPEGWQRVPGRSVRGEAPMVGGTYVAQTYAEGEREVDVGIVVDSAMLTAMMELARTVGKGDDRAISYETDATANAYTAELVKGAFVVVKGRGMSEAEGKMFAERMDVEALARLMGIGGAGGVRR